MSSLVSRLDSLTADDGFGVPAVSPTNIPSNANPIDSSPPELSLNPLTVMKALSVEPRLRILDILSRGTPLTGTDLTKPLKLPLRRVLDHLAALTSAGLLVRTPRTDRREIEHAIRPGFLRTEGNGRRVVDYGTGLLRFG